MKKSEKLYCAMDQMLSEKVVDGVQPVLCTDA
jgi:hypothetical protein